MSVGETCDALGMTCADLWADFVRFNSHEARTATENALSRHIEALAKLKMQEKKSGQTDRVGTEA